MEDLCKIRDVYRAIAEFETQFIQQYNLSVLHLHAKVLLRNYHQ